MYIRPARPEEGESLKRIMRAAIRSGCARAYGVETVKAWTAPGNERFQFRVPARSLVAEEHGRLMGFSGWRIGSDDGSPLPRVTAAFVVPEFTGRGLGKALLKAVEEDIREDGHAAAYLYASLNAVPFYLARGYSLGPRQALAVADDHYIAIVRMDKGLTHACGFEKSGGIAGKAGDPVHA